MKKILSLLFLVVFLISCWLDADQNVESGSSKLVSISTDEFAKQIQNKLGVILDVRTLEEYNSGYLSGAIQLDYYKENFSQELDKLDKNSAYYIYCRSWNRSGKTLDLMKQLWFQEVYDLDLWIIDWQKNNYEIKYISK